MKVVKSMGWQFLFRVNASASLRLSDGRQVTLSDLIRPGKALRRQLSHGRARLAGLQWDSIEQKPCRTRLCQLRQPFHWPSVLDGTDQSVIFFY
jgi:hypothetical protein